MCLVIVFFETGTQAFEIMDTWRPYQIANAEAHLVAPNLYELRIPIR